MSGMRGHKIFRIEYSFIQKVTMHAHVIASHEEIARAWMLSKGPYHSKDLKILSITEIDIEAFIEEKV